MMSCLKARAAKYIGRCCRHISRVKGKINIPVCSGSESMIHTTHVFSMSTRVHYLTVQSSQLDFNQYSLVIHKLSELDKHRMTES